MELKLEKNARLHQIIKEMKEEGKDFYDCLWTEEEDKLNEKSFRNALYLLTDNDQVTDSALYTGVELPYHLVEANNNEELKDYLQGCRIDCRVLATYWKINVDNAIMIDEIVSQGEWELEGADALYTLFDFESWDEAEELAEELNIGYWYFSDTIQIQYLITTDELELHINNNEHAYHNRQHIYSLIEKLDNYDEVAIDKMIERIEEE